MSVLENLEPKSVFKFFEEISYIPRGSGNEKAISDFVVHFAKERNLEVHQDTYFNVIIKKPGTQGLENIPALILQGHLDMVCEKNMDKVHDFEKDPIHLQVQGDYVMADGTTLGADNGIAVAYALALLDSQDIAHPPLEIVLTTDEEVGMVGALKLDTSKLTGKYFVNLDSEEEGELLVSCAGGLKAYIHLPVAYQKTNKAKAFKIFIKGLKGGHSGMEIDKNRANANKLIGRLLFELKHQLDFDLFEIAGGLKDNAIPREAYALIMIEQNQQDQLNHHLHHIEKILQKEYKTSDPNIQIMLETAEAVDEVFTDTLKDKVIFFLLNIPNGIQTMSADIEGLVESSLNLGVIQYEKNHIKFVIAVRSSVRSKRDHITNQLKAFATLLDAEFVETAQYPEWEYNKDSKLRELFVSVYEDQYGKQPLIKAIHAGLECGVFAEKIKDLDLISLGPDMFDVHTPDEKVSISSTKRTWEYLLEVLKNFKKIIN